MYEDYFVPFPVIETERLVLRMVKRSDAKQLFDHCSLKETSQFSLWSPHKTLKDTKDFIAYQHSLYKKKQCYFFVVEEKLSKEVIGTCSYVSMEMDDKVCEIGYSIIKPLWNCGFGTETALALTEFAFKRIGAQRVFARVLPQNIASAKVLEKIGFLNEGRLKKGYYYNEKVSDVDVFGITDTMFKEVELNGIKKNRKLPG